MKNAHFGTVKVDNKLFYLVPKYMDDEFKKVLIPYNDKDKPLIKKRL